MPRKARLAQLDARLADRCFNEAAAIDAAEESPMRRISAVANCGFNEAAAIDAAEARRSRGR